MDDVLSAVIERLEKSEGYYPETFYLMQNQLLTLGMGQSDTYQQFVQSCEAYYGRPMSELVEDLSDQQKVDLAQLMIANSLDSEESVSSNDPSSNIHSSQS